MSTTNAQGGAHGAHGSETSQEPPRVETFQSKCTKCTTGVREAIHSLMDEVSGAVAWSWQDDPGKVRQFVRAGAVDALENHGWRFTTWPDGRCFIERIEDDDPVLLWLSQCCQEGGELPLDDARASYRAWSISYRCTHPERFTKDRDRHALSSPPRANDDDGKRLLRRLGYRTTRKGGGPTRFVDISLIPEVASGSRRERASDHGDVANAVAALEGLVDDRTLDVAYLTMTGHRGHLCTRCGVMTSNPDRLHTRCPDVRAQYGREAVPTVWVPGMGGLAEEEVERDD